jgi:hypothetical protein
MNNLPFAINLFANSGLSSTSANQREYKIHHKMILILSDPTEGADETVESSHEV